MAELDTTSAADAIGNDSRRSDTTRPQTAYLLEARNVAAPEQEVQRGEQRNEIMKAINTLGDKHRLVVILRYYAGFSNEEIARALSIPSGTVRSRLHTARQRLKRLLADEAEQDERRAVSESVVS